MKYIKLLAVLSTLCVASFSHAKGVQGFYIGAGVGSTSLDDKDDFFEDSYQVEESGNTYKLIAGYQLNRTLALEAQYTNYGDANIQGTSVLNHQKITVHSWTPEALSFAANAGYTFNNGLRPFGVLGLSMIDLNESKKVMSEDKYLGLRYGFGLEYMPPALNALSVRLAYEADFFFAEEKEIRPGFYSDYMVTELYDFTLDSVYLSVSYRF
ncbi:Outer membrane protein [Photobacterium marinum]|uniref:Outer membrane protein n=1 Tax=Photobacterium marinum TaxID=1056511 RepID=L8J7S5_9GAMM|nr:porin family protein [Photobacterium marinum]ELR64218.1 Outer membrane protein [Photobacterium marinum]